MVHVDVIDRVARTDIADHRYTDRMDHARTHAPRNYHTFAIYA